MLEDLLGSLLKIVLSGAFGYLLNTVKNYKKRDKTQEEALKCLLRSTITSKYFVYTELGNIPEYEKENVNYLAECYFSMGGNSSRELSPNVRKKAGVVRYWIGRPGTFNRPASSISFLFTSAPME